MMKKCIILLSIALLAGCNKVPEISSEDDPQKTENPKEITLELSLKDLIFEATEGEKTFTISCNSNWTLTHESNWCSTDFIYGIGNQTITVTTKTYENIEDRNTNLTVKAGEKTQVLSVTQKGKDAILLSKDKYDIQQEGGTMEIEVKSNTPYITATIPSMYRKWLSYASGTRAITTKKHYFTVAPNDSTNIRSGFIIFSGGSAKDTIYVHQAPKNRLIFTQNKYETTAEGGIITIELRTNIDYDVVLPAEVYWLNQIKTRSFRTDRLSFSIQKNESNEDRETAIVIKDRNSTLSDTLYIHQAGKSFLSFSTKSCTISQEGGTVSVEATSNINYKVTVPETFQDWIRQLPLSRITTKNTYEFSISVNETFVTRKGYVIFTGNTIQDTFYIIQMPKDHLKLVQNSYDVTAEGGTITVELQTNIDYEVILAAETNWVNQIESSTLHTDQLSFSIQKNENNENRKANIVVKERNGSLSDTLYIHQAGITPILSLPKKSYTVSPSNTTICIEVNSNIPCDIKIPSKFQSWISQETTSLPSSRTIGFKTYNITITKNIKQEFRTGYVVFSNNFLTDTLHIRQLCTDFTENLFTGVSFDMIYVQGGTFKMGATAEQGSDAFDDETPIHQVTLSDYYIGKFEVTQSLWEKVMGTTIEQIRDKAGAVWPLRGVGPNYPIYNVNWKEVQEFCKKLSQLTGKKYTLPTEAQWEFAARGGIESKGYKYSGSNNIGEVAWYDGNSHKTTHEVGQLQPNELGIYDMTGNVHEWCHDMYSHYSSTPQTDPTGPSDGSDRVVRGGNHGQWPRLCRVSRRQSFYEETHSGDYYGFRLVLIP